MAGPFHIEIGIPLIVSDTELFTHLIQCTLGLADEKFSIWTAWALEIWRSTILERDNWLELVEKIQNKKQNKKTITIREMQIHGKVVVVYLQ